MTTSPYEQYKNNSVLTASGPELTLMLYNGAIKFCNLAKEAIINKDIPKSHENIVKAENIIEELKLTLNKKYPISEEMDRMYTFINQLLIQANIKKDVQTLEDALSLIREFRDTWQEAMKKRN
jgi:flagellar protein FliS